MSTTPLPASRPLDCLQVKPKSGTCQQTCAGAYMREYGPMPNGIVSGPEAPGTLANYAFLCSLPGVAAGDVLATGYKFDFDTVGGFMAVHSAQGGIPSVNPPFIIDTLGAVVGTDLPLELSCASTKTLFVGYTATKCICTVQPRRRNCPAGSVMVRSLSGITDVDAVAYCVKPVPSAMGCAAAGMDRYLPPAVYKAVFSTDKNSEMYKLSMQNTLSIAFGSSQVPPTVRNVLSGADDVL